MIPKPEDGVLVKLASLVVHVQEATSDSRHQFDVEAAGSLAESTDVVEWLDSIDPVLLPSKR